MQSEHVKLGEDGRIVIPASARRELGFKPGEVLVVEADGNSLRVRSYESVVQETKKYFSQFTTKGVSEVDALIEERRAEAQTEEVKTAELLSRKPRG